MDKHDLRVLRCRIKCSDLVKDRPQTSHCHFVSLALHHPKEADDEPTVLLEICRGFGDCNDVGSSFITITSQDLSHKLSRRAKVVTRHSVCEVCLWRNLEMIHKRFDIEAFPRPGPRGKTVLAT